MKLCVETSTTFDDWVRQSEQDYKDMLVYLKTNDFKKVGELTEKNALAMARYDSDCNSILLLSDRC